MQARPESMRDALRLAVAKLPNPVRFRAENAMNGFDLAYRLLPIDREMASFRAITAEEEAATALFRSLQLQAYPGSEKLNLGNHRHKAAVRPFLSAVSMAMSGDRDLNLQLALDYRKPSLEVSIELKELGVTFEGSENLRLTLAEPLGVLGSNDNSNAPGEFFSAHIQRVATAANFSNINKMIEKHANDRNLLLYASDQSKPRSKATHDSIGERQKLADAALYLSVAVLQTRNHQALAKQALEAFLAVVGKRSDTPGSHSPALPEVTFKLNSDGPTQVSFHEKPAASD